MKPLVKIVLFIGLFLLIIAIFSYGYFTYKEGFQSSSLEGSENLAEFCAVSDNTCTPVCYNGLTKYNPDPKPNNPDPTNPDPNALLPETPNESDVFNVYEYYNLQDINNGLPLQATTMKAVNMASVRGAFDNAIPTPWDYDNISLDPTFVLWGSVDTATSRAIFECAYTRATMQSANSADFINSNPTNGVNTYTSTLFNMTLPNGPNAQLLQTADTLGFLGIMVATEHFAEGLGHWSGEDAIKRHEELLERKRASKMSGNPKEINEIIKEMDDEDVVTSGNLRDRLRDEDARSLFNEKNPDGSYKYRNAAGTGLNQEGLDKIKSREGKYVLQTTERPSGISKQQREKIENAMLEKYPEHKEKLKNIFKSQKKVVGDMPNNLTKPVPFTNKSVKNAKRLESGLLGKIEGKASKLKKSITKAFEPVPKPMSAALGKTSNKTLATAMKGSKALFAKKLLRSLISMISPMAILEARMANALTSAIAAQTEAASLFSLAAALFAAVVTIPQAVVVFARAVLMQVYSILRYIEYYAGTLMKYVLMTFEISCYTWIPAILGSALDSSNSVCPITHKWTFYEAVMKAPGGQIGWEIIASLPEIGDFIGAFGPYICWYSGDPNDPNDPTGPTTWYLGQFLSGPAKFMQTVHPPTYYYDSTLSLYTIPKVYGKVMDPLNPQNQLITNGMVWTDPAYYDPAKYKDPNGHYPIWVDYANEVMLDKMGQFYHDYSRAAATVSIDGTSTYQYISKFYGVISSSEFSCDIQCEISEITIDAFKGIKLCERIVPVEEGGACTWHDRRFYWSIDITAGINLESDDLTECGNCFKILQNKVDSNGRPSSLDPSDPCIGVLGVSTMYSVYGQPIGENISGAQRKCAQKYLMNNKSRSTWDPAVRMKDNMDKFFITGCTHVDGTAPVAADVSNQDLAGTQIGNSIVAVGSPSYVEGQRFRSTGKYYAPKVGEVVQTAPASSIVVPRDQSCDAIKHTFVTYGTTSSTTAMNVQAEAAARAQNVLQTDELNKSNSEVDWVFSMTKNDGNSTETSSVAYNGTTKFLNTNWTGCEHGVAGLGCVIKRNLANIIFSSVTAWMGTGGTPGVPGMPGLSKYIKSTGTMIGLVAVPIANVYMGIDKYLDCLTEGSVAQTGTFILNGNIVTSESSPENVSFVLYQGPIMPFSPGYTPKINFEKMVPGLNLMNCVNRYTVRYFMNTFKKQYPSFTLTKIANITPRRIIKSSPPDPTKDNSNPCCVFNVEYRGATGTPVLDTFALNMKLQGYYKDITIDQTKNTFIYQPTATITKRIPPKVPLTNGTTTYTSMPSSPPSSKLISPDSKCGTLDCNNFALQTHIFEQFNVNHLGVSIDLVTDASGKYKSVLETYTPNYILDDMVQSCVYKLNLEISVPSSVEDNLNIYTDPSLNKPASSAVSTVPNVFVTTPSLKTTSTTTSIVKMYLAPVRIPTTETECLYDLDYDDYPNKLWYTPVPLKYFEVPTPDVPINPNFSNFTGKNSGFISSMGSTAANQEPCYTDCSGAALMQNLITQFNTRNQYKKINSITRSWTPALNPVDPYDYKTNPPVCDYDVEMVRTNPNGPTTLVSQETVRFYLKPTVPPSCEANISDPSTSGFDLDHDDSDTPSSGLSLNNSTKFGLLESTFIWSPNFMRNINSTLNNYILEMIGLKGPDVVQKISKNALSAMNTILEAATLSQTLNVCPVVPCNDPYILQRILNRFNFGNYPKYPTEQYNAEKISIVQFRRAGISSPMQCQVELIEERTVYNDFLYEPVRKQGDYLHGKRNYLQQWAFNFKGVRTTGCKFTVEDISGTDITNDTMNVATISQGGETPKLPYAIMSDYSKVDPALETLSALNPTVRYISGSSDSSDSLGSLSSSEDNFTYKDSIVDCLHPSVLAKIESIYNSVNVATNQDNDMGRVPKYNKLIRITQSFNPVPNVCEYQAQALHTQYDSDYGWYYTVPKDKNNFNSQDYTYLVATWAPNTDYEIETGKLLKNTPSLVEYYLPNLDIVHGKFYFPGGTSPVDLPYLTGVGMVEFTGTPPKPRFQSVVHTFS